MYRLRLSLDTVGRRVDEIIAGIRAGKIPGGMLLGPGAAAANLADPSPRWNSSPPCRNSVATAWVRQ